MIITHCRIRYILFTTRRGVRKTITTVGVWGTSGGIHITTVNTFFTHKFEGNTFVGTGGASFFVPLATATCPSFWP